MPLCNLLLELCGGLFCIAVHVEADTDLCWQPNFLHHIFNVSGTWKDIWSSTPSDTITANPPPIRPANTQICPAVFITAEHKHSFSSQKCSHTLFTEAYQRLIIDFHGSAACGPSWRRFEPHATKTERRVMQKEALESPALHLIDLLLFHQQRWELLLSHD